MLTLTDFIAHIKANSIARSNRYDIVFSLPPALLAVLADGASMAPSPSVGSNTLSPVSNGNPVGSGRIMSLSCLTADIPARSTATADQGYGNYQRRVAYDRGLGEFTTTFIITGKMDEKRLFDAWHSIIFQESNHRISYYDDYNSSIDVQCLDNADKMIYHFELTEAWPVAVSSLRLDRTSTNQQMLMDVTWAYHKMIIDPDSFNMAKDVSSFNAADVANQYNQIQNNLNPYIIASTSDLNIPDVPNVFYTQVQANDVIKAVRRVREQIKNGNVTPQNGLMLLQQITRDFKSITGIPPTVTDSVTKSISDVMAGMPISVPGIPGGIPQRLPF